MATVVTRSGKGSPLTNNEVDANFNNLNTEVGAALPKAGGAMTGAITTNSTIDGRDVAADGVTADAALPKSGGAMTGAITTNSTFDGVDIATRDAVLTNTTTTANAALPKAGGALSGAVTTNSTFDGRDVAADGVTADAALPKAGGAMTGAITTNSTFDGRDVATDGTKLDGVEASADVTDTANVTSAGALMDSELTSIASVKALNQGLATGNSPTFVDVTATSLDISGNIDVDGTTNLDVVDIDGACDMATTLTVGTKIFTGGMTLTNNDSGRIGFNRNPDTGASVNSSSLERVQINGPNSSGDYLDVQSYNSSGTYVGGFHVDDGAFVTVPTAGKTAVFNEAGVDVDFRVESDGNANMLFVDGGNNRVGIGTSAPDQALVLSAGGLQITGQIGSPTSGQTGAMIDYSGGGARYWSRGADASTRGTINFYQLENDGGNQINSLSFSTAGAASFSNNIVTSSGKVIVGSTSSVFTNSIISATSSTGPVVGAQSTAAAHYAGGFHNTASGAVDLVAFYTGSGSLAGSIETGSSGEFIIESSISDKDLVFKGNDGGSAITALTLDMSTGGTAYFGDDVRLTDNHAIRLGTDGDIVFYHDNSNGFLENGTGNLKLDVAGQIILDADGSLVVFADGGVEYGRVGNSSGDFVSQSLVQDKDIVFKGNDGGSIITALTLDMSAAGAAYFGAGVFAGSASSFPSIKVNNNSYIGSANNATAIQIATSGAVTFSSAMTALSASASVVTAYLANSNSSIANSASSILYLQTSGDAAIQDGYKMVTFADSDTVLGSISTASNSSNVTYNTSSDERLKENIVDMPSQLENILKVQPRQFDWKKHGNTATGFIAQELHKTYPEAVSVGLEDETQDPWSVDYGRLTPYIIKAMQEQQTLIETLTARVAALEE